MNPIISVIIPVYNTAKYLDRCLDSILFRSDLNVEVICINDGSVDDSLNVLLGRKNSDNRIIVINQDNQGVSVARNNGLKTASGTWIVFVDSDDILLEDYYYLISNLPTTYDFVMFDSIWGNKKYSGREKEMEWTNNEARLLIHNMLLSKSISDKSHTSLRSACIKAYRNDFLQNVNANFPEEIKIGEDMLFNIPVFAKAVNVKYYPIDIYQEIDREGSATHSFVPNMIDNDILFQNELRKRLIDNDLLDCNSDAYFNEIKSGIIRCLRKQVFSSQNTYSRKEQRQLLCYMQNCSIYKEGISVKDKNYKRNIILLLYKLRLVVLLNLIFLSFDK